MLLPPQSRCVILYISATLIQEVRIWEPGRTPSLIFLCFLKFLATITAFLNKALWYKFSEFNRLEIKHILWKLLETYVSCIQAKLSHKETDILPFVKSSLNLPKKKAGVRIKGYYLIFKCIWTLIGKTTWFKSNWL